MKELKSKGSKLSRFLVFPSCYMRIFKFGMYCHVVVEQVVSRVTKNQAAAIRITAFMEVIPSLSLISVCFLHGLIQEGWVLFLNTIQFMV